MEYNRALFMATWRMAVGMYSGFGIGAVVCWGATTCLRLEDVASGVCMLVCAAIFGTAGMLLGSYWGARKLDVPWWPLWGD